MNRYDLLLATIAAVLIAGCASVTTQTAEPQQDKTVVTGSRLPAREGAASADVKSIGSKEGIDDMMKRGSVIVPQRGGGM
jgi:PBP1b-binding outer membrane lipoprotein LpoB